MKANINLELDKDDLNNELESLVREIAEEEIKNMVRKNAKELVQKEVKKIISPIIDSYLENAIVGREYPDNRNYVSQRNVDEYIKSILKMYLDEPCYLYSKSSNTLSQRYMPSSDKREATRAEHWIVDKVRKYAETEFFEKIENCIQETINKIAPNKEQINAIIKKEIAEKILL